MSAEKEIDKMAEEFEYNFVMAQNMFDDFEK